MNVRVAGGKILFPSFRVRSAVSPFLSSSGDKLSKVTADYSLRINGHIIMYCTPPHLTPKLTNHSFRQILHLTGFYVSQFCQFISLSDTTDPDELGGHFSKCPDSLKSYCVHGECRYVTEQKAPSCRYSRKMEISATEKYKDNMQDSRCQLNICRLCQVSVGL